jgi:hypothetical protein
MRKYFNLTTVASGAALGMIIAGILALVGGGYANNVVHDQLSPQKIYFPAKGKALPANLNRFAGQQVDTATEAKAYANDFIALHLKEIGGGKTYSQVSAAFLQDPTNQKLAQTRQTLFQGETLRGLLLGAWGWGTIAMIATIAGFVLIGLGAVLVAVPVAAAVSGRRRVTAAAAATSPTPAI